MRVDTCVCWYLRDLVLCGLHVVPAKDHKDGYTATSMNKKSLKNRKRLRARSILRILTPSLLPERGLYSPFICLLGIVEMVNDIVLFG